MTTRGYVFDLSFVVTGRNVQDAVQQLHALLLEKGADAACSDFVAVCEDDESSFVGQLVDVTEGDTTNTEALFTWDGGERDGQRLKDGAKLWA